MNDHELRRVYERYMNAPLGELQVTAETLRTACRAAGWSDARGHFLPWVRDRLKVEIVFERKSSRPI